VVSFLPSKLMSFLLHVKNVESSDQAFSEFCKLPTSVHAESCIELQGMLCSRGELLLMLDSDGATRFTDFRKLELQVRSQIFSILLNACIFVGNIKNENLLLENLSQ